MTASLSFTQMSLFMMRPVQAFILIDHSTDHSIILQLRFKQFAMGEILARHCIYTCVNTVTWQVLGLQARADIRAR